ADPRGDPNLDPKQMRVTGAFTMHASSRALVAASKAAEMVPRLLALRDAAIPLVFVIGELNRGVFSSEALIRRHGLAQNELTLQSTAFAPGDIMFVPECGHGMHYENPESFWRVCNKLVELFLKAASVRS